MNCVWNLPYPVGVSTNKLYRGWGHARRLTPEARQWRETVILHIRQQAIVSNERLELPPGNLAIWIDSFPPDDHREHDGDNVVKPLVDSVMAAFGELDARVREHHVYQFGRALQPRLQVMITPSRIVDEIPATPLTRRPRPAVGRR